MKSSENIVGKGENAGHQRENAGQQHFLIVPHFLRISKNFCFLSNIYFVVCKRLQFGPV